MVVNGPFFKCIQIDKTCGFRKSDKTFKSWQANFLKILLFVEYEYKKEDTDISLFW